MEGTLTRQIQRLQFSTRVHLLTNVSAKKNDNTTTPRGPLGKMFTAMLWEPRSELGKTVALSNSHSKKTPLQVTFSTQLGPMTSELSPLFWAGTTELIKVCKVFKIFQMPTYTLCLAFCYKVKNQSQFVKVSVNRPVYNSKTFESFLIWSTNCK